MNGTPAPAPPRPVDLKRRLLLRVTLFAFALLAAAGSYTLLQARERIRSDIQRTGATIRQLIQDEVARNNTSSFNRTLQGLDLSGLDGIGGLIHFCVTIEGTYRNPVIARCFGEDGGRETQAHPLAPAMRRLVGSDAAYHGLVGIKPGIKVAELRVTPDFDSEAAQVWRQLRNLLAITAGVLLINVLVYRPVRRALAPTDEILQVLGRMEAGDLGVRMPAFELVELSRIAGVFNHMAERLQQTRAEQQRLAQRLLDVREDERRHLARELHDELGQCLASINAEAAYAGELARERLPALQPCAEAIARTTAHMMEVLQQILHRLRPVGLDEFGLAASLGQMVGDWERRSRGQCSYRLDIDGEVGDLPDNLNVNLYRIVQESLTNAAKHGQARRIDVRLRREPSGAVSLEVEDDGAETGAARGTRAGGFGLIGMHERVQALGGTLAVLPRTPRGVRVEVHLPSPQRDKFAMEAAA